MKNVNDLLKIFKRQHMSLLNVLLTIPFYSKDQTEIINTLNSYSPVFYKFFESLIFEIVNNSTLKGIRICGDKKKLTMKADETFLKLVKDRLLAESILVNEIEYFQGVTVKQVLEFWNQYQNEQGNEHGNVELLLDNLKPLFDEARAERIWNFVVSLLFNIGQFELAKVFGVTTKKWVTMRDVFVRELHRKREGLIAPLDGLILGARYPRDPRLPLDDIINCRCYLEYC